MTAGSRQMMIDSMIESIKERGRVAVACAANTAYNAAEAGAYLEYCASCFLTDEHAAWAIQQAAAANLRLRSNAQRIHELRNDHAQAIGRNAQLIDAYLSADDITAEVFQAAARAAIMDAAGKGIADAYAAATEHYQRTYRAAMALKMKITAGPRTDRQQTLEALEMLLYPPQAPRND
jgi:hypothetical protein